ncbi:MAG: hypothetical protein ACT4TC_22710 [Myxococcaceae bacterium]
MISILAFVMVAGCASTRLVTDYPPSRYGFAGYPGWYGGSGWNGGWYGGRGWYGGPRWSNTMLSGSGGASVAPRDVAHYAKLVVDRLVRDVARSGKS